MDPAVKKSNKENTKPAAGLKRTETRNVGLKQKLLKAAPLKSKNSDEKKEGVKREKAEAKEPVKPVTKPKTLSQAFRTEQSVRHRKLVMEVQQPPPTVPPKPIPGTYKGRVVKSKIDCFRKPPSGEEKTTAASSVSKSAKPSRPKPEVGTLSKVKAKSVTTLPGSSRPRPQTNLSNRTKSASDAQLSGAEKPVQRSASQRQIPPKAPASTRPVAPRPATLPPRPPVTTARPASSKVTSFIRKKEPAVQSTRPAAAAVEQKSQRPAASSTVSQYRVRVESAEERRAKLSEWLASKGKTLKRPPITEKAAPTETKTAPPPNATQEPSRVAQLEPKARPEENQPGREVTTRQPEQNEVSLSKPVFSSSPSHIINTTLDLLDNSDMDLPVDPEIRMESLVLNLCDKLDAMETPSSCKTADPNMDEAEILANVKVEEETEKEFEILEEEELEAKAELLDDVTVDGKKVQFEYEEEVQEQTEKKLFNEDDEKMDSTPEEETGASVVKYNVKTTPFLQSVKKRIEIEETASSASRRKSAIKDLKFLTPVRRSSRIQRKSSRLPDMLNDHDPCVSSLAELVQLDDADSSAYIYRKNPALLDQPGVLEKLSTENK